MASKTGYPGSNQLDAVGAGRVAISGRITTANGTAPTITAGSGFTVARTAEGRFTVTLTRAVMEIVAIHVDLARETLSVGTTTGANELVQCYVDQDTITTSVFEVQIALCTDISAGVNALDDQPGSEIHFTVIGRYSSIDS